MKRRFFWFALLLGTAGTVGFLSLTAVSSGRNGGVPLGIPGEWTWQPIPLTADRLPEAALGWLAAAVAFLIYGALAWCGAHRVQRGRPIERGLWLAGLVVTGFFWVGIVQQAPPEGYRLSKVAWVLYYPRSSGYFYEARYEMDDTSSFLAAYESKIAEGDVLHVGTHPPGLFLFHHGLIGLCRRFPALTELLLATRPSSVTSASILVAEHAREAGRSVRPSDQAALWLAALLTQLVGVATVVPLYGVLRLSHPPQASWMASVFWPLVPALSVFLPKSDALYPFLGMVFLFFWLQSFRARSTARALVFSAAAGLCLWVGMFLSLALLPVAVLAAALGLFRALEPRDHQVTESSGFGRVDTPSQQVPNTSGSRSLGWSHLAACLASAAAAFLATVAFLWIACDVNLLNVWAWNLHNHEAFYDQYRRTWWKWVLVNPLELGLAVGWPVMLLVLCAYSAAVRTTGGERRSWTDSRLAPYWCCALVWGLLWLSGKNSGEAARLWLVIMPWLLWLAAGCLATRQQQGASKSPLGIGHWTAVVLAQAVTCVAAVTLVSGFHY